MENPRSVITSLQQGILSGFFGHQEYVSIGPHFFWCIFPALLWNSYTVCSHSRQPLRSPWNPDGAGDFSVVWLFPNQHPVTSKDFAGSAVLDHPAGRLSYQIQLNNVTVVHTSIIREEKKSFCSKRGRSDPTLGRNSCSCLVRQVHNRQKQLAGILLSQQPLNPGRGVGPQMEVDPIPGQVPCERSWMWSF